MKTVAEIRADVARRLARTWAVALTAPPGAPVDGWPHAFALGQPTSAELAGGFANFVRNVGELRAWADSHRLDVTVRARRVRGTDQELPTHVTVPDVDTAAGLAGGDWLERLARGRRRAAVLVAEFPELPDRARTLVVVDGLSDVDFDLACRAGHWFATNDATGLTPRQVPVEGLHAKWLNTRHALVRDLAGVDDLKLAPPHPARVHFTYLDPGHRRAGHRIHDSATVGDAPALAYRPDIVVISENKDTALHFPELPGALSVEGVGRGGGTAAAFEWLVNALLIVYWGDMDADGLEILDGFRAAGVPARSILMDVDSYDTWERFGTNLDPKGRPLIARDPRPVPHLTDAERALYERLTAADCAGPRRVEQERIPLAVALEHVRRLAQA
ncbi:MAG TPA: Wadjet anti-phage system protein JetD domain-containing protein [Solirubrobacteraceae bacterium]|nr:Wadjet anti-phage system protein JetD domain-containing protein [Solirubrobacteraceae bacterium]